MKTRVLMRPYEALCDEWQMRLAPDAIMVGIHEAAHATVVLAYGAGVGKIDIQVEGKEFSGSCYWSGTELTDEQDLVAMAAGAASTAFTDRSVYGCEGEAAWTWSRHDQRRMDKRAGRDLSEEEFEFYRAKAFSILLANQGTFDRLAAALLDGDLDEDAIRAIAKPGMLPDPGTDITDWTRAQRCTLADKIESMVKGGDIPPALRRVLAAAGTTDTTTAIRYGDTVPVYNGYTPTGYQHRMLRGAR